MSLELGPKGLLVFEDYAKGNASSSNLTQRKGIPGQSGINMFADLKSPASLVSCACMWQS